MELNYSKWDSIMEEEETSPVEQAMDNTWTLLAIAKGKSLMDRKEYAEAVKFFPTLFSRGGFTVFEQCEILVQYEVALHRIGDLLKLADAFSKHSQISDDPDEKRSLALKSGTLYFQLRKFDEAVQSYRRIFVYGDKVAVDESEVVDYEQSTLLQHYSKVTAKLAQKNSGSSAVSIEFDESQLTTECMALSGIGMAYVCQRKHTVIAPYYLMCAINYFELVLVQNIILARQQQQQQVALGKKEQVAVQGEDAELAYVISMIQQLLSCYESLADCHALCKQWDRCDEVTDRSIVVCDVLLYGIEAQLLFPRYLPPTPKNKPTSSATSSADKKGSGKAACLPYSIDSSEFRDIVALLVRLRRKRARQWYSKGLMYNTQPLSAAKVANLPAVPAAGGAAAKAGVLKMGFILPLNELQQVLQPPLPRLSAHLQRSISLLSTYHESLQEAVGSYWQFVVEEYAVLESYDLCVRHQRECNDLWVKALSKPFSLSSPSVSAAARSAPSVAPAFMTLEYLQHKHDDVSKESIERLYEGHKALASYAQKHIQKSKLDAVMDTLPTTATALTVTMQQQIQTYNEYQQIVLESLSTAGLYGVLQSNALAQRAFESAQSVRDDIIKTFEKPAIQQEKPKGFMDLCGDISYHLAYIYLRSGKILYAVQEALEAIHWYLGPVYDLIRSEDDQESTTAVDGSDRASILGLMRRLAQLLPEKWLGRLNHRAEVDRVRMRNALGVVALAVSIGSEYELYGKQVLETYVAGLCLGPIEDGDAEVDKFRKIIEQRKPPPPPPLPEPSSTRIDLMETIADTARKAEGQVVKSAKKAVVEEWDYNLISSYAILCAVGSILLAILVRILF